MECLASISCKAMVVIVGCIGIIFAPGAAHAQCPDTGSVGFNGVVAAKGKPFQAKEVTTIVTYGFDGTKRTQVTKSNLLRDSKGRVRVERFFDGTDNPSEILPTDILIYDNCGTSLSLSPSRQTGKISNEISRVRGSNRPYCEEFDLNNLPKPGPEGKFEYLGHKMIDGVEVQGQRTSDYSSLDAKLSGASPVRIYESWCSIALDTPMGSFVLSDKPKREISTVISDLRQIEPDQALFEIPEGYTMTKPGPSAQASGTKDSSSITPRPK
jgi:hypothetical protein